MRYVRSRFFENSGDCGRTKAADYLRRDQIESNYAVEVAHKGTDRLHADANGGHELVILDVILQDIEGFSVLSTLATAEQG